MHTRFVCDGSDTKAACQAAVFEELVVGLLPAAACPLRRLILRSQGLSLDGWLDLRE